jgi:hypothetical protein
MDPFDHAELDGESRVFGDLRASFYSLASFAPRFARRKTGKGNCCVVRLKPGPISEANAKTKNKKQEREADPPPAAKDDN